MQECVHQIICLVISGDVKVIPFSQGGYWQCFFCLIPFHCFEDILWILEVIYFGPPEVALAMLYDMLEGLFGFLYVFRPGAEIPCDPAEHLDNVGTTLVPPSMTTWAGECLFDGSLQSSGDCLGDAGCKSVQLRGERRI